MRDRQLLLLPQSAWPKRSGSSPYSRIRASTGSSRDADRAGTNPKTTPINVDEPKAMIIVTSEYENRTLSARNVTAAPDSSAKATPVAPPTKHTSTASIRNCSIMSPLRAPTAMRTPISLVRSLTETSMIFMTPIPPTINEITAISEISNVSV
jgi:hypothetical protein